jgi:hypothetical protein
VVSVWKGFDNAEGGAFTAWANVFHEFFDEAEVIDLLFVEFPNGPLMGAGVTAKAAVASPIRLVVAVETSG